MESKVEPTSPPVWSLFPVKHPDGTTSYYASNFSESLGNSVFKGYPCRLISTQNSYLRPCRIKGNELQIDESHPIAIKIYDKDKHPSAFQYYASEIALLSIEDKDVLIMELIDGFHIYPHSDDNPKLKGLTFFQAVDICWQLVLELNRLHYQNRWGQGIVHGDIKGENVKIRIKEFPTQLGKQYKIDVQYLDLDYAKPISSSSQTPEGTAEHLAIELLNGLYSESSDFFALSPLLLSIFGAENPLRDILAFRNSNTHLQQDELVKALREISFNTDGFLTHFDSKPKPIIAGILEEFIVKMGGKEKRDRPTADAILEFFTALRQLCLFAESSPDSEQCLLRLCVASGNESWLQERAMQNLFLNLEFSLQKRLIGLMTVKQIAPLYKIAKESEAPSSLTTELRSQAAVFLAEAGLSLKKPSFIRVMFSSALNQVDIQWLLECFEHHDMDRFNSLEHEKRRKKLEQCAEKELAPLIELIIEDLQKAPNLGVKP